MPIITLLLIFNVIIVCFVIKDKQLNRFRKNNIYYK